MAGRRGNVEPPARRPSTSPPPSPDPLPAAAQERSVVDGDGQRDALEQGSQALELRSAEDVEGDEEVFAPRVGEGLRFAQLLAGQSDGAERELPPRDLDGAVRLHVRPVGEAVPVAVFLPAREVALQSGGVHDGRWRLDLGEAHPGRRATASISTKSPAGRPACTVVRAGYGSEKNPR